MKTAVSTILLCGTLAFGSACSDREVAAGGAAAVETIRPDDPEDLGRLGGRIANEPQNARELIAGAGMTREEFEARVRAVAERPDESRKYAKGFEEVRGR